MSRQIPISQVQEYDIIKFSLEKSCGTLQGVVKGTVVHHRGELVVFHNKVTQARYSDKEQAGSPTYFELRWLAGELPKVELLFRRGMSY
ncbi:hypothetical protein HBP99_13835 [Listeria booriae]|uniref:hypothetical protein n=1 Tax=Listeria booriae TaxID=1552123 RepID=UPI001626AA55|nr:hypothetical protein [Listeria booriae]MBC2369723.1 hypothetical protein [Listeria booriae]